MTTQSRTLETPDVDLVYEVRPPTTTDADHPTLLMAGHPMDARGFDVLASHFTDRTVVTYDPRGVGRSVRKDGSDQRTPAAARRRPARPDRRARRRAGRRVRQQRRAPSTPWPSWRPTPTTSPRWSPTSRRCSPLLPDADHALAAERAVQAAYHERGFGAGMAAFIALTSWPGEFTDAYLAQPPPDPAQFGMPTEDDGRRDDPLLSGTANAITSYRPDPAALRGGAHPRGGRRRRRVASTCSPAGPPGRWHSGPGPARHRVPQPPRRVPRRRVRLRRPARGLRRPPARGARRRRE